MAAQQATHREPTSTQQPMTGDRFVSEMGAGGLETTSRAENRRDQQAIDVEQPAYRLGDEPRGLSRSGLTAFAPTSMSLDALHLPLSILPISLQSTRRLILRCGPVRATRSSRSVEALAKIEAQQRTEPLVELP
jgi:hypothetical protein